MNNEPFKHTKTRNYKVHARKDGKPVFTVINATSEERARAVFKRYFPEKITSIRITQELNPLITDKMNEKT